MSETKVVVVGSTFTTVRHQFLDENNVPINITGATNIKLRGASEDIVTVIDKGGSIVDAANGIVDFVDAGAFITSGNLNGRDHADYTMQARYDAGGKTNIDPLEWALRLAAAV